MMTPEQIDRLAAATNALRPDWPIQSLRTFIERNLANRAYRDACVAFAWVANTDTETPRLIVEAGPWWRAVSVGENDNPVRKPPKAHEECGRHPGQYRLACGGCAADKRAVREEAEAAAAEQAAVTKAGALTDVRAQLALTRAALCGHGVPASHCAECAGDD